MQTEALLILADSMSVGSTRAIDRQVERSQQQAVTSTNLPIQGSEAWKAFGFKFGEKVDDLFCEATMPDGWSVRPTKHSMWNEILDQDGVVRGQYFYKGVFYDRDAFLNAPYRRYSADADYTLDDATFGRVLDRKTGETVFKTDTVPLGENSWETRDKCRDLAVAWLLENFPTQDARAYWSER